MSGACEGFMNKYLVRLTLACFSLFITSAFAADAGLPRVAFTETRLDNGLRVILAPDHSAPVLAVNVIYDVGSRNERPGRTGFAHLFEHMMFQGSENVGKGEHFMLLENNGGDFNGTTNEDRTTYFEIVPKNQLDLALFLEADRMGKLAVNQVNLDNQRNAVQEERRLGIDNQPYGKSYLEIDSLAYDCFGYKHSTIGSMADLSAADLDDVKDFFRRTPAHGSGGIDGPCATRTPAHGSGGIDGPCATCTPAHGSGGIDGPCAE